VILTHSWLKHVKKLDFSRRDSNTLFALTREGILIWRYFNEQYNTSIISFKKGDDHFSWKIEKYFNGEYSDFEQDPSGRYLLISSIYSSFAMIYDLESDKSYKIGSYFSSIRKCFWSPCGCYILVATAESGIHLYETHKFTCEKWYDLKTPIENVIWSLDQKIILIHTKNTNQLLSMSMDYATEFLSEFTDEYTDHVDSYGWPVY
jgi:WD40 repeat protein